MQALILTMPSESLLAELSDVIDVEAIHYVRQFMCRELGLALADHWRAIYQANQQQGSYAHNAGEVARRSLKNLALRYLCNAETDDSLVLVQSQLSQADNMTDRLSALATLVNDPRDDAIGLAERSSGTVLSGLAPRTTGSQPMVQVQSACSLPEGLE